MPEHPIQNPKKLIICCDGTWHDATNRWTKDRLTGKVNVAIETNVSRIVRAIKSEDHGHHPQIVYYQAGVGTGIGLWDHIAGGGTGRGLEEHIREAYAFLASNYREHDALVLDDSIFLIGFSRGAFTARSLGGLIGAVGLLKKELMHLSYAVYNDWENAGASNYDATNDGFFKKYFEEHPELTPAMPKTKPSQTDPDPSVSIKKYFDEYKQLLLDYNLTQEVKINAIGVWDTVGSLGIPVNPWLQRVFHLPSYLRHYKWFDTNLDNHIANAFQALSIDERRFPYTPAVWERRPDCTTNLKQVWFPGVHSNCGGGYLDGGCSDVTLAWMMDQLGATRMEKEQPEKFKDLEWIRFDHDYIDERWNTLLKYYQSQNDLRGWAKGTVYDSLTMPQSLVGKKVRTPGQYYGTNYKSGRPTKQLLGDTEEYIHASVRARIDLGGNWYEHDAGKAFPSGWDVGAGLHIFAQELFGWKPSLYNVHKKGGPLWGWKLDDGHESHDHPNMNINMDPGKLKHVQWDYVGKDPLVQARGRPLKEDRLGHFELMLLRKDKTADELVETSNNGWRKVVQIVEHAYKRAITWN